MLAFSVASYVVINVLKCLRCTEMVGTARHSAWLHSTDIHSAQKTPSDTVSVGYLSLYTRSGCRSLINGIALVLLYDQRSAVFRS